MMGNSPWIALIGGVRWSLGLGWWGHRWWVAGGRAGGRASGWCVGGSGGRCLRVEARWRRPGWRLGLCLGLLLGLLRLLGLERQRRQTDQYTTISLTSAAAVFDVWLCEWLLTKTVLGAGVGPPAAGAAGLL